MNTKRADISLRHFSTNKPAFCQNGSVIVEFAFILPILLILLFGVASFSIALYNKTVLNMATREGARTGVVYDPDGASPTSKAQAAATQILQNKLISFGAQANPTVTSTASGSGGSGDILTVTASMNYTGIFILLNFSDIIISSQTSMRIE